MDVKKPNDILVATLNNPNSSPYDFMTEQIGPENTSLFSKDEYLATDYVQEQFKNDQGDFDNEAFENAYMKAATYYKAMSDESFLDNLATIEYSPFDITRPIGAKTFTPEVAYDMDWNPFKDVYSRRGINSITPGELSPRELAQQNRIYDPESKTWSDMVANDVGLIDKFFGDTLVYGQWDEDGIHDDPRTGRSTQHKKGEWKYDDHGNLFLEKLGEREIYGKQVVNPLDMLTDDGSLANKYIDIWDSDSREKSIAKSTAKLVFDIAPFFIPGVGQAYGGLKAVVGLSSIMPTFYKAFEGILLGDSNSQWATQAESYMAKFNQNSVSDKGSEGLFNYEQLTQIVGDVFSQLYEQRAAASLSMLLKRPSTSLSAKSESLLKKINEELGTDLVRGKITLDKAEELRDMAMRKLPEFQRMIDARSQMAKSLSLGYMALTQSAEVYGEAIEGGYDRRTAGFAALAAAAGQYGIMSTNEMGTWFLDSKVGYTGKSPRLEIKKAITPWLDEVETAMKNITNPIAQKATLAQTYKKIKGGISDFFLSPAELGKAMLRNAAIEGFEEVTEQAVMDATKGIVDTLSYLGLTKKQGSFGGFDNVFSQKGLENYLANFVGGLVGGALFEFQRARIDPLVNPGMVQNNTKADIYALVADGNLDQMVAYINKNKYKFGNSYVGAVREDGTFDPEKPGTTSQADLVAAQAINMLTYIDGIINSQGLKHTDEEVVRKALRDSMIINDLAQTRGKTEIGIEGLILTDFRENVNKIIDLSTKINQITSTTPDADLTTLEEMRNMYKKNVEDILSGDLAEKYYTEALMYLTMAKEMAVLDKNTFAKQTFGMEYNAIPDEGVGLTKAKVDESYAEYIETSDIVKYIKQATAAYVDLEQKSNGAVTDFIENGYADERIKTFKTFINQVTTSRFFDVNNNVDRQDQIEKFISTARDIEKKFGEKILPWDVIFQDFGTTLSESPAFTLNNGDQEITINEETKKKSEIASEILNGVLNTLPPNMFDFDIIAQRFAESVNDLNQYLWSQNPEVTDPLIGQIRELQAEAEEVKASAVRLPNETDQEYETKLDAIQAELKAIVWKVEALNQQLLDMVIDAKLTPFLETKEYADKYGALSEEITTKYNISPEDMSELEGREYLETLDPEDNIITNLDKMRAFVMALGGDDVEVNEKYQYLIDAVAASDMDPEDKVSIITDGSYKGELPAEIDKLYQEFFQVYDNTIKIMNTRIAVENTALANYKAFKKEIAELKADLIKNQPNVFGLQNMLAVALIKELQAGNIDGELLILAKKVIGKMVDSIGNMVKGFNVSNENVLQLTGLSDAELQNANRFLDSFSKTQVFAETGIEFLDNILRQIENGDVSHPDYTKEILGEIDYKLLYDSKDLKFENKADFMSYVEGNAARIGEELVTRIQNLDATLINQLASLKELIELNNYIMNNRKSLQTLQQLIDVTTDSTKFKPNPIYAFLRDNFDVYLERKSKMQAAKIWDLLEAEEQKISLGPSVESYLYSGATAEDIRVAINALRMLKTVIKGLSTTEVGYGDPYGFIASRQNFAKKNGIESDVLNLKTASSDMVNMMHRELDRIISKLEFYVDLAKSNSGLLSKEQKMIQDKFNALLYEQWKAVANVKVTIKEKVFMPDLEDIITSSEDIDRKLFLLEEAAYESTKDWTRDEKLELAKTLAGLYPYSNTLETIYNKDGTDEITRDMKGISNNDMLLYLLSAITVSSRDFNTMMSEALNKFDKAPFFTQKLGIRIMYSSLVDKDLFSDIIKYISPIEGGKGPVETHDTSLITYILGSAGTGKTTVMYKVLLLLLEQTNQNVDIWFSAPEQSQAKKLTDDVMTGLSDAFTTKTFSKERLFEEIGLGSILKRINSNKGKDLSNPSNKGDFLTWTSTSYLKMDELVDVTWPTNIPNLIFIDEITHFTALEQSLLNAFSEATGVKIYGAGDIYQRGVDFNGINYNVGRTSGVFAPNLFLAIRPQNGQKRGNNQLMFSYARKINRMWDHKNTSTQEVFETILKEGVTLHSYVSNNVIDGDLLTNAISPDILKTLANIVKADSTKIIGILEDFLPMKDIVSTMSAYGIPEDNYKVVTKQKVQGQEFDYFIFNAAAVGEGQGKEKSIFDGIKALYTYMSRAKSGSIIVKDEPLIYNQKYELNISKVSDNIPDLVTPLTQEEIDRLISIEKEYLNKLLGGIKNIDKEFRFSTEGGEQGGKDGEYFPTIVPEIHEEQDSDETLTGLDEMNEIKFGLAGSETLENTTKAMVHPFYHDTNVKATQAKNGNMTLTSNPALNAQFSYLFKNGKKKITLTEKKYYQELDELVREKFSVLKDRTVSLSFMKKVFDDPLLTESEVVTKFVIVATQYKPDFNDPVELLYDNPKKHLAPGSQYMNYSVKLIYNKQVYYLHLGTLAAKSTLDAFADANNNAKLKAAYNKLSDLLALEDGDSFKEIEAKPNRFANYTSTRLYQDDSLNIDPRTQNTISRIVNLPGVNFYQWGMEKATEPTVMLYPDKLEDFIALYRMTTFGKSLLATKEGQDKVEALWSKRRNKPFIAVSFIDKVESIKFIPLWSKKRSFESIENRIVKEDLLGKVFAQSSIFHSSPDKSDAKLAAQEELAKLTAVTDSFFSSHDILELLIDMAQNKPELFKKFIQDGEEVFNQLFAGKTEQEKKIMKEFFGAFNNDVNKTVWDLITNNGSVKVFEALADMTINHDPKKKKPTKKEIKAAISKLARTKEARYWFTRFWRLIAFERKYAKTPEEVKMKYPLEKELYERLGGNLSEIVAYWRTSRPMLFYNIPLEWHKIDDTKGALRGDSHATDLYTSTYSAVEPEGPRMLLDISNLDGRVLDSIDEKLAVIQKWDLDALTLKRIAKKLNLTFNNNAGKSAMQDKLAKEAGTIADLENARSEVVDDLEKSKLITAINAFNLFTVSSDITLDELRVLLEKVKVMKEIINLDKTFDPNKNTNKTVIELTQILDDEIERNGKPDIEKQLDSLKANVQAEQISKVYPDYISRVFKKLSGTLDSDMSTEDKLRYGEPILNILKKNPRIPIDDVQELLYTPENHEGAFDTLTGDQLQELVDLVLDLTDHC